MTKRIKVEPLTKERALEWVATVRGAGLKDAKREALRLGITEQEIRHARRRGRD